jgi:hypothetical protein
VEGFQYEPAEMRARELALFGGTNQGEGDGEKSVESKFAVTVGVVSSAEPKPVKGIRTIPDYVKNIMTQGGSDVRAIEQCTFDVSLIATRHLNDDESEGLLRAMKAWIRFGGVGARTRRGAGCVELVKYSAGQLPDRLLPENLPVNPDPSVPTLHGARQWTCRHDRDATGAWFDAVNLYQTIRKGKPPSWYLKKFRPESEQDRGHHTVARSGEPFQFPYIGPESHSTWPERKSIAAIQSKSDERQHFPRALFGLPIQFRFKGGEPPIPPDVELKYGESGRLGSPLIVRPYKVKDQWRGAFVLLNTPRFDRDGLRLGDTSFRKFGVSFGDLPEELISDSALESDEHMLYPLYSFLEDYLKRVALEGGHREWEIQRYL